MSLYDFSVGKLLSLFGRASLKFHIDHASRMPLLSLMLSTSTDSSFWSEPPRLCQFSACAAPAQIRPSITIHFFIMYPFLSREERGQACCRRRSGEICKNLSLHTLQKRFKVCARRR